MNPLFFKPIPFTTVWGGTSIKKYFGYDWMPDTTGQAWAFAAQEQASNECISGEYAGKTLSELWCEHPELFGDTNRVFPVIISMLCPAADLSIQVHPDAEHAQAIGYPYGKNEAWYFLDAAPNSAIVYGHNAANEAELRTYVESASWDKLIRHLTVHEDDFVYIPAGTLHACCKQVIAYEVQQSTDVTYRFYDYDRLDDSGNKRELHVEEAIGTLHYEKSLNTVSYTAAVRASGGCIRTTYVDNDSFRIEKLRIDNDSYCVYEPTFELVSVVRGSGTAAGVEVHCGSHFLIPKDTLCEIAGDLTCMMTTG